MLAVPMRDADEVRDNATFAAVLQALSQPGTVSVLPESGPLCIALALIDRECRVHAEDAALADRLRLTGASVVPPDLADHVFLDLGRDGYLGTLMRVPRGSPLYPDTGATVIAPCVIGEGPALRLTGPGIDGETVLHLGGLHSDLWRTRGAICRYPTGIEMILHDAGRIVALPRSTMIEEV